jgi:flagellar basal body rod protein FlgG
MKNGDVIQNSVVTNTLAIVEADKNAEIKAGVNNQYTIDADGLKTPAGYNLITQGFRENSNVNRANEMIKMINGMHAYESNQKSIIANDEEISRTINELGKF